MCKNATQTAANFMAAIEPTLVNLLTDTGIAATPNGIAAIAAYNAAEKAVAAWVPGTAATEVAELVQDFNTVFQGLPVPADFKTFASIIAGGIQAVLTVLVGNTTSPATAEAATPEEAEHVQTMHAHEVGNAGVVEVAKLTGYHVSLIDRTRAALGDTHIGAKRYTETWLKAVETGGPKYATLATGVAVG